MFTLQELLDQLNDEIGTRLIIVCQYEPDALRHEDCVDVVDDMLSRRLHDYCKPSLN